MIERVGKFTIECCSEERLVTVSGPNHSATHDIESLRSRIRFIRGMRKRPKYGHFYEETLQAHLRAYELLEGAA